jgi:hypothetical protein
LVRFSNEELLPLRFLDRLVIATKRKKGKDLVSFTRIQGELYTRVFGGWGGKRRDGNQQAEYRHDPSARHPISHGYPLRHHSI